MGECAIYDGLMRLKPLHLTQYGVPGQEARSGLG